MERSFVERLEKQRSRKGGRPETISRGSTFVERLGREEKVRSTLVVPMPTPESTFAVRIKQSPTDMYIMRGTDSTGKKAWYYIKVRPNRRVMFDQWAGGPIVITDFADIIKSGYGEHPPDEVKAEMKRDYGFEEAS